MNGQWKPGGVLESETDGSFNRPASSFRNWVGDDALPYQADRYRLYVSHACPWSHRTTIMRALKQLEADIPLTVVKPHMGEQGWEFDGEDEQMGARFLHELYTSAQPDYSGKATVPVLWDTQRKTIVNNESADIMRMFNALGEGEDYYPSALREEIDAMNALVYERINNGVYKCGFATQQRAYEEATKALFEALDTLEHQLTVDKYLVGGRITEADWRLFVTLVRFDLVYYNHFNCNLFRIADYPYLRAYMWRLYRFPSVEDTVHIQQIKHHYFTSHPQINPLGIIPLGPEITPDMEEIVG